ncbi:hypothetical protein TNCV_1766021 [Trichonephila clavipes]|nr:hypothetical protein TNCV_1766021 [Trichonephila clavipes]
MGRFKQGRASLFNDERSPSTSTIEDNVQFVEDIVMEWVASIQRRHHTFRKQKVIALLSSLMQIDNGGTMLNSLLHSKDYERRRVTRCIEVLLTTPHSALGTGAAVQLWKEKLQKFFLLFDLPL